MTDEHEEKQAPSLEATVEALRLQLMTLRDRFDRLESALGMRRWDDPGPASTVRLGPAFLPKVTRDPGFRVAGPDGEVRPARHDFTERELVAMDREALRAQADVLRVQGYDGSETTIEIPPFDPLGTFDRPTDLRVVFGARCSWWETIDKADQLPSPRGDGLPCCPHCRSVLYEVPSEAEWWAGAELHEAKGHPGYRAMIEWGRGRCFPTPAEHRDEGPIGGLAKAYQAATGEVLPWASDWTRS